MKKVTMNTFKKLSREQLIALIEKAENVQVIYNPSSKAQLINIVVGYYNQGIITRDDLI